MIWRLAVPHALFVRPLLGWCLETRTQSSLISAVGPVTSDSAAHVEPFILHEAVVASTLYSIVHATSTVTHKPREWDTAYQYNPQ